MKDKYTNGSDDFEPEPSLVLLVLRWNQRSGTMALNGNPLEWWELDRGNHPKSSPLYHIFSYIICIYIYIIFPLISGEWIGVIQQMLFWHFSPRKTAGATSCDSRRKLGVASHLTSRYCCCLSFWAFLSVPGRIFYWDEQEMGWNLPRIVVLVTMRHGTEWD